MWRLLWVISAYQSSNGSALNRGGFFGVTVALFQWYANNCYYKRVAFVAFFCCGCTVCWINPSILKVMVYPKMKILSSFTRSRVVLDLYEHKNKTFWRGMFVTRQLLVAIDFRSIFSIFKKFLKISTEEIYSCRFGTTWWTIPGCLFY